MAKSDKLEKVETSDGALTGTMPRALTGRSFDTMREIIETNLGSNAALGFSDLTRISMPAGGGTIWQIPKSDGTVKNQETITGVVVAFQDAKAYWEKTLDESGGGTPPDCRSVDMIKGIGNPGILCSECPFNIFGSAAKGEGKACKDLRMLYILSDDSILPKVIVVPPTSLAAVRKQFLALATEDEVPYYGAMLSFGLEMDKNNAGIKFSKIKINKEVILEDEFYNRAKSYNEMLKPMLNAMFTQVIEARPTFSEQDERSA